MRIDTSVETVFIKTNSLTPTTLWKRKIWNRRRKINRLTQSDLTLVVYNVNIGHIKTNYKPTLRWKCSIVQSKNYIMTFSLAFGLIHKELLLLSHFFNLEIFCVASQRYYYYYSLTIHSVIFAIFVTFFCTKQI